jgi:hypothetical protein
MKENTFYENLFAAKKEIGKISKDSTNPFFKSKYFDINSLLEHVEPILNKHGLFVLQPIENGEVVTRIFDEQGFSLSSGIELPKISDPQKLGSAVTYYRRYTLQSLLALQAEDDDANAASKATKSKPKLQVNRPGTEVPTPQWHNVLKAIDEGKIKIVDDVRNHYTVDKMTEAAILLALGS